MGPNLTGFENLSGFETLFMPVLVFTVTVTVTVTVINRVELSENKGFVNFLFLLSKNLFMDKSNIYTRVHH